MSEAIALNTATACLMRSCERMLNFPSGREMGQLDTGLPLEEQEAVEKKRTGVTDTSIAMHHALTKAMAMPAFNLNIKNRQSSGLLVTLIVLQTASQT